MNKMKKAIRAAIKKRSEKKEEKAREELPPWLGEATHRHQEEGSPPLQVPMHTPQPATTSHSSQGMAGSSVLGDPEPRKGGILGDKRPREGDDMIMRMMSFMEERDKAMRESFTKELEEQRKLISNISKSLSRDDDVMSMSDSRSSDNLTNILVRERATVECSRGPYGWFERGGTSREVADILMAESLASAFTDDKSADSPEGYARTTSCGGKGEGDGNGY